MITKNYFPPDVDIYNDLGTYVIIGNSSTANHIVLTIDSYNVYQKIKKVILFLPCNSDTNQEDFKIKENSSSTRISYANKVIRNNIYYLCFELTPYFNSSPSCTVFSFLLLNNDTDDFSIPNYSSMFLQIVHEEPFDYLNNLSLIQRKIGSSYIYKHDIITSYGFLSKDLYEKSFPYELKLVADMYEPNNQFFDFLPKGWTLNLLERIIVDQNNNSYILIDGDFIRHKFYNNSNSSALIYVDDYGTGLLMEKVDASTYKVFSPINSAIKFFNADGKITKSVLENGKEINFSYTNSTIIISDYLGNTLTINKVSNTSITIVSSAINKIYTLTINSNCLIGLSCIGSNDLTTVSDSYTYDNNSRLSQLNTFDGYKLFITSDFDNYSFTIKKATTDLEKYSFARYLRYVEVTHLNGIVYKYYFDDDHNINVFGENTGGLEDYDCILFQSPLLKSFSELYKITIKEHLTVQLYHSTDLQTPVFDSNSPYSITATRQDAATNTVIVTKAIQTEMDQTKPRFILFRVNNNPSFINSEISKLNLGLFRGEVTSLDSSVSLFDISFIGEGYCLCQIPPYIPHNQFSIGYDGNCGYFTISDVYFLQLDNCPNGNLLFRKNDSSSSNFISIGDNNKYFPISSIKFDSRQLYENDIKINQIIYRKYSYAKYFFTNNLRDLFLFTDNGTYRSVDIDFFEDYTSETPSSINVQFENTVFAFYQEQNSVLKQASIISTNDAASYKISQFLS